MELNSVVHQVIFALLGGIAAELLHWYRLSRKVEGVAGYSRHSIYWITTAAMVMLGGIMPLLYISGGASALLCFHLGATAPIALQKLVAGLPSSIAAQGSQAVRLREFFKW